MDSKVSVSPTTTSLIDQIVVPGDVVLNLSNMTNQTIKLGSGLRQDSDVISAMRAGKFSYSKPNKYWVESSHKRYIPRLEDNVLGIVVDSKADNYWVDIKGPQLALLPRKKKDPKFEALCSMFVLSTVKSNKGMNSELCATDAIGNAAEFGPLRDGFMFETSTGLSRMLLSSPSCPVLEALGKKLSFETATGLNGRVWVKAAAPRTVVIVANAIMNSESLSGTQQRIMVETLLAKISD
ncbi:unnamed protein product [Microthlaspi erraticum]|uniref:Uncharacterized protein n=1 Tax=Microthlaspi erraticum TaxID=1685480 RepID=A0A6D2JY92_9BRAS|nr:unnamed protein product [Microthlaspi erraticum]